MTDTRTTITKKTITTVRVTDDEVKRLVSAHFARIHPQHDRVTVDWDHMYDGSSASCIVRLELTEEVES